jgi:hypothetical protein
MTQNCGEKKETCHIFYIMKLEGGGKQNKTKKKNPKSSIHWKPFMND